MITDVAVSTPLLVASYPPQSHSFFRLAADKGDAEAQYCLGQRLKKGQGVAADPKEAERLFVMAAEQGHANAMVSCLFTRLMGGLVACTTFPLALSAVVMASSQPARWYNRIAC